ncbi:MAG: zf-TFIIB domain-containing protein [Acidobacteria bacterium]|nr:zf-TFIIB domain-containing protein [Acidobacteriota bacterium]
MDEALKICPECEATLDAKTYKLFHVWVCPEGHGTLYPKGELEKIAAAVSGIGGLELRLWNDHERFSVSESPLMSPDGPRPMIEIRDTEVMHIMVYGDPVTHSLWVHTGEEEKLVSHLEHAADDVASYVALAAKEAVSVFSDELPLGEAAGHALLSLKLLGERVLRALPFIAF